MVTAQDVEKGEEAAICSGHERVVADDGSTKEFLQAKRLEVEDQEEEEEQLLLREWPGFEHITRELKKQKGIAGPIAAMNLMWFGRMVISTAFLGSHGKLELAGGALALTFANVTGFSVLVGLSGGLESVCGQAFGAGNYKLLGSSLYRGIFLLLFTSVPIGLLWLNVEGVLVHLGQDTAISKVAGTYLLFLLPDLVATSLLEPLRIYLRSQCITKPMMTCSAIAVALHVPINIFLRRLGVKGAALAICWSDFNVVLLLVGYVVKTGLHRTTHEEGWWRLKGCSGCVALLRLSVASCLMTCLEWWCYEIVMLITGRLPRPQESVSELAIMFNADQILFALMLSLGSCASTRVSNELGGNRPVGAYHAAAVSLGLSVVIACAGSVAMISGRNAWGGLFSRSEEVVRGVGKLLCVMGVMEIFNFPQAVSGGVLRGTGRPSMAVYANLGAFYLLGLPLGTVLAFKFKMGLMGLMVGLLVAISVCATLTVTVVLRMDWVQQALIAQNLTSQSLQLQPLAFDDDEEKDFDGVDRK